MDDVEALVELAMLYDFYGGLLKEHNKEIFEDYVLNDLSLAEIADTKGITRQGVHDVVKRCSRQLHEYENELQLVCKFKETKAKLLLSGKLIRQSYENNDREAALEAERLIHDVVNGL